MRRWRRGEGGEEGREGEGEEGKEGEGREGEGKAETLSLSFEESVFLGLVLLGLIFWWSNLFWETSDIMDGLLSECLDLQTWKLYIKKCRKHMNLL